MRENRRGVVEETGDEATGETTGEPEDCVMMIFLVSARNRPSDVGSQIAGLAEQAFQERF